jgi:hypothetical protein
MKKELIAELFLQFENAVYDYKGIECWSARELQQIFNYTAWRNFLKVIEKAKGACNNAGEKISDHFVDLNKMVELGSGSHREIEHFRGELVPQNENDEPACVLLQRIQQEKNKTIKQKSSAKHRRMYEEKMEGGNDI